MSAELDVPQEAELYVSEAAKPQKRKLVKDMRYSRLARELDHFTTTVHADEPVATALDAAADKGLIPESLRGANDGVEIISTRRGHYIIDTKRKNDPPALKTDELYSWLRAGMKELFDRVELDATSEQWEYVGLQKKHLEKVGRARDSWLGKDGGRSHLDALKEEEVAAIREVSKYGRPLAYVHPTLGAAYIDGEAAKARLPKIAAALKYLAPHGTREAKSMAMHVCGLVGDVYAGELRDFNPSMLGGEVWNGILDQTTMLQREQERLKPVTKKEAQKKEASKKSKGAAIITLTIGAAAAAYVFGVYVPGQLKEERLKQLTDSGMKYPAAAIFDDEYVRLLAKDNHYNSSSVNLGLLHGIDAGAADGAYHYARCADGSVWGVVDYLLAHPQAAVSSQKEWYSFAKLLYGVDGISAHPELLGAGAEQVACLLYEKRLADQNETKAWDMFAKPAVREAVGMVDSGIANITGWSRSELRRFVLPIELAIIRVQSKNDTLWADIPYSIDMYPALCLENGIKNVNPSPLLNGTSLQQWLTDVGHKIYNEKGARYRWAIEDGRTGWAGNWPNARKAYQERLKDVMKEDELAVFIYGNGGIGKSFIGDPIDDRVEPLMYMKEQHLHYFKVLLGRSLGRVVVPYSAPYPEGTGDWHDESFVKTKSGEYIGLWADLKAFVSDYTNSPINPRLVYSMDGVNGIEVDLRGVK